MPDSNVPAKRLLLVAWAGADWRIAQPMLDAGELPHLAALVAGGARGNLATLNPHSAPMQWTSLITGKRADKHGLLSYWQPVQDRPVPISSHNRTSKALWNLLSTAGLRVHAVGWPFSHSAEPINGCLVSDLYAQVDGEPESPTELVPGTIYPKLAADDLESLRIHPGELGLHDLSYFVQYPETIDQHQDTLLRQLATSISRSGSVHAAATELMTPGQWDAVIVQYDALDVLGHPFMALQPPRLEYVPLALFQHYSGVVQAMYRFLDMQLGRLLELAGTDCTVMLVSQRGYKTGALRPQTAEIAAQQLAAPWFRDQGMIVLNGSGVSRGARIEGASLLDVVPTALTLLGLSIGKDMDGRILRAALEVADIPKPIGSWETPITERPNPPELSGAEVQAILRTWQVYQDAPYSDQGSPPSFAASRADWDFNLAMVYLESNRPKQAEPLLAQLVEQSPDDARLKIHLARCREALGDREGAIGLYTEVVDEVPGRPREQMALAALNAAREDDKKALMNLFRAEQAEPNDPMIHCRIGEVYLRMKRWQEAQRAFNRAVALDSDSPLAHHGLAIVRLAEGHYEEAMEAALTAVGLRHNSPQAHFHLGIALAHLGQQSAARTAFETCVILDPRNASGHRWLAKLWTDDPEKAAEYQRKAAELEAGQILRDRAAAKYL